MIAPARPSATPGASFVSRYRQTSARSRQRKGVRWRDADLPDHLRPEGEGAVDAPVADAHDPQRAREAREPDEGDRPVGRSGRENGQRRDQERCHRRPDHVVPVPDGGAGRRERVLPVEELLRLGIELRVEVDGERARRLSGCEHRDSDRDRKDAEEEQLDGTPVPLDHLLDLGNGTPRREHRSLLDVRAGFAKHERQCDEREYTCGLPKRAVQGSMADPWADGNQPDGVEWWTQQRQRDNQQSEEVTPNDRRQEERGREREPRAATARREQDERQHPGDRPQRARPVVEVAWRRVDISTADNGVRLPIGPVVDVEREPAVVGVRPERRARALRREARSRPDGVVQISRWQARRAGERRMSVVSQPRESDVPFIGALRRSRDPLLLGVFPVIFAVLTIVLGWLPAWGIGFDFVGTLWEPARALLDGNPIYPEPVRAAILVGNPSVYPPVAMVAATPLALLPQVAAAWLWFAVLSASVLAALWILGVRDWRCFVVAVTSPVVVQGTVFGNLTVLLVLAIAVAWRYRERTAAVGLVVGAGVAAKFVLWPLVVWLRPDEAVSRRGPGRRLRVRLRLRRLGAGRLRGAGRLPGAPSAAAGRVRDAERVARNRRRRNRGVASRCGRRVLDRRDRAPGWRSVARATPRRRPARVQSRRHRVHRRLDRSSGRTTSRSCSCLSRSYGRGSARYGSTATRSGSSASSRRSRRSSRVTFVAARRGSWNKLGSGATRTHLRGTRPE